MSQRNSGPPCTDSVKLCLTIVTASMALPVLKTECDDAASSADLTAIAGHIAAEYPHSNRDRNAMVIPLVDAILGDVRPILVALLAGSGLLSLIGFVNVSNLLLVRAEGRRREIAVREALGAGHPTRSSVCRRGLPAGSFRLLYWLVTCRMPTQNSTRAGSHNVIRHYALSGNLHINLHLLAFGCGVSIVGGLLFSAFPQARPCSSGSPTCKKA
jgi:macrolide transport system ATP-binding/permease protein